MLFSQKDILEHKFSLNLQNFYYYGAIIRRKSKILSYYKFTKGDFNYENMD